MLFIQGFCGFRKIPFNREDSYFMSPNRVRIEEICSIPILKSVEKERFPKYSFHIRNTWVIRYHRLFFNIFHFTGHACCTKVTSKSTPCFCVNQLNDCTLLQILCFLCPLYRKEDDWQNETKFL